jgi:hypothetical protein
MLKKTQQSLFLALAIVLLASPCAAPVAAATDANLTITNNADVYRYVVLTGPQTVTQMVFGGQTVSVELPAGLYDYSYWACGVQQFGVIRIKTSGPANTLTIPSCVDTTIVPSGGAGTSTSLTIEGSVAEGYGKLIMVNNLWQNIQVTFTGASYAWLNIAHGRANIDLPAGRYTINYTSCGLPETANFQVLADRTKTIYLQCDNQTSVSKAIGRVLMENHTGSPVRVIITSPIQREIVINGSRLLVYLPWDDYTFYAFVDGNVISGVFEASKDKTTLKLYPTRYTFTTG